MQQNHDYRQRCYQEYITKFWQFSRSSFEKEYFTLCRHYRNRYEHIIPSDKSARILDLPCGSGHFLYYLQKEGYVNSEGIDLSQEQLELAKKTGVLNVQKADLFEYLPAHPESYDMIFSKDVVEHFTKTEVLEYFDLIHRSLRPGGKVVIETVNLQSLFGTSLFYNDFTHETGFTPLSLSQVMRICGFDNIQITGEKPISYDFKSFIRRQLWTIISFFLKTYITIERGTGRGIWSTATIFEPRMIGVGTK